MQNTLKGFKLTASCDWPRTYAGVCCCVFYGSHVSDSHFNKDALHWQACNRANTVSEITYRQTAHFLPALLLNPVTQNPAIPFHVSLKMRREMAILQFHKMMLLWAVCIFECSKTFLLTKCWRTECSYFAVHCASSSLARFHMKSTTVLEYTVPSRGRVPKGKLPRALV